MAFADRYVLGERVGMGATGEVLRAFDQRRGIPVAIKRLHEHLVADPFSRERFRCEIALSSRVDNEHVVRCFDGGIDEDDRPYLVLEWLDGQDLATRMKTAPVPFAEALEIVRQTALGLDALHQAGIVHRDVKPRNLFLTPSADKPFVVKLLDLGVAFDADGAPSETVPFGTPFYMSPEQARATASIGPASDLFALAALAFELFTNQRPFSGPTTFVLLAKISLQMTPRLSDAWPEAPPELDAFLARCMARDPTSRFGSARAMAEELAHMSHLQPTSAAPLHPPEVPSVEPDADHLMAVIFGRLPRSTNVHQAHTSFQNIVRKHQGSAITLLGRGVVSVFHGECADALLRAADAVLELAEHIPGARWSLSTDASLPVDAGLSESLIDRGTFTLERPRTGPNESPIRLDDQTASLLEEHYVIEGTARALSLRAVRPVASRP